MAPPARSVPQTAQAIAAHLEAGLPQDRAGLDAICQTLGEPDAARALDILAADPESSDAAPLVALLFSPGPETRRVLEPVLAQAGLDAQGAEQLAQETARLATEPGRAAALLPGGARVTLAPSVRDITGFVRRLRPEATAPAELRTVLTRRFAPVEQALFLEICAALRHSRLAWTPARVFFLSLLLEKADGRELPGLLAWAAGFLDLAGPDFSPRAALMLRRQALLAQLRQAEAQEEATTRGSFEVRLSQGLRMGHLHAPDLRAELVHLDRACALVLGIGGEALSDVSVLDLGEVLDADGLLRLFRDEPSPAG